MVSLANHTEYLYYKFMKHFTDVFEATNRCSSYARLALLDSTKFDPNTCRGGPNGSVKIMPARRFAPIKPYTEEIEMLQMQKYKAHPIFDNLSFADYLQLGAATAIEFSGGPERLMLNSFLWGRKDLEPGQDTLSEAHYGVNNEDYEKRMQMLGFTNEEIAALGILDSFGIIATAKSNYREPRFTNNYYKNLLTYGKADKNAELPSDRFLLKDKYKPSIQKFADDKKEFFKIFQVAFMKTTKIGWGPKQLGGIEDFFDTFEIRNP